MCLHCLVARPSPSHSSPIRKSGLFRVNLARSKSLRSSPMPSQSDSVRVAPVRSKTLRPGPSHSGPVRVTPPGPSHSGPVQCRVYPAQSESPRLRSGPNHSGRVRVTPARSESLRLGPSQSGPVRVTPARSQSLGLRGRAVLGLEWSRRIDRARPMPRAGFRGWPLAHTRRRRFGLRGCARGPAVAETFRPDGLEYLRSVPEYFGTGRAFPARTCLWPACGAGGL